MSSFLLRGVTTHEMVNGICSAHGLTRDRAEPWTHGVVYSAWADAEETFVVLADDARSGAQLLHVVPADTPIAEALRAAVTLETVDEALSAVADADAPLERVRALYRVHAFRLVPGDADQRAVQAQCDALTHESVWVRWAAARLLSGRAERVVEEAAARAAELHPELSGLLVRVREQRQADDDGTLFDTPTDAWHELLARAREGLDQQQPKRVARAMDSLLAESPEHVEGLLLRGRAYADEGMPVVTLALLGAAHAIARAERDQREGKALVQIEVLLREIEAARTVVGENIAPTTDDAVDDTIVGWLERWARDGRASAACAAALAVMDLAPNISGLLAFVAGQYRHDRARLEHARTRAPRSAWCLRALAAVLKTEQPAEAAALYDSALSHAGEDAKDTAREHMLIERLGAAISESQLTEPASLEALLLEDLAGLHYDERNWDEAIQYADRLVVAAPKNRTGWQWRANARTFASRHDEAVLAYEEALAALGELFDGDSIAFGSDPRPGMHYSLASVLAKLDRPDDALDHLRRAVRADAKWGADAQADDFFETLWNDDKFARIVAGDAEALVLHEERNADFVDSLVNRALGLCHAGNYTAAVEAAERATLLAKLTHLPTLHAKAVSVHGRALALSGQAELGVAKAVAARALADDGDVHARVKSEIVHELGVALHAAGNHERAEDAYRAALTMREEVYGSDHPIVAKSLGDLARLASDGGKPALSLIRDGVTLLERYLAADSGDDGDDDTRDEARVDLAILQSNLAENLRKAQDVAGALVAMEACATTVAQCVDHGSPISQPVLDHALNLAELLVRTSSDDRRAQARSVVDQLETLLTTGSPDQLRERAFWLRLRRFVRNTVRGGVPEATLARTLNEALRGGGKLPLQLRRIPEIAGFSKALAERAMQYPTLLAMAVMALSTAEANGDLDRALENLQELCVAAIVDGVGF